MAMACVITRALCGVDAPEVTVEVHLSNGLPAFSLVGLPETSVKESRERVRSAIINSGFEFPMRRITVNLAPAELPKQGGRYDLPIAIGILAASGQIPLQSLKDTEFAGELALSGEVRECPGMLPMVIQSQAANRTLILPVGNRAEAELVGYPKVRFATHLQQLSAALHGQQEFAGISQDTQWISTTPATAINCLSDVIGQYQAKQALEIAAAGNHNLLFLGPPGTGKTMLASRIMGLLPQLDYEEALDVAAIHSVAGMNTDPGLFYQRPFRAPHHTSSSISLVGGGAIPKPGEISLAHRGVLFLDELTEFPRKVLDCLRVPMETGEVVISRAAAKLTFASNFQLIAAMNPSPCGDAGPQSRATPEQISRYLSRLSGPFLDRFDLSIDVPRLPAGTLSEARESGETSEQVRARVLAARDTQLARAGVLNSALSGKQLEQTTGLSQQDLRFLEQSVEKLGLSVRSFHRLQRVARTIADLDGDDRVERRHLARALGFRAMDRLLTSLAQTR
ncbi:YifB family Mg chelatase-like AAA ATPase [Shewanella corallii]|uniref:YifB family Mg chelatase-like AAA ATPase n=1 Tax=Shewanella corallii TaxID=560080 RepID=A0ABT0NCK1_9GAMM|nr:YifB family Mg chelatase-like AAA ATPase [Shewanella corallii]MCL2916209.1 YifB family Mg chelatase-like AAA ATPase [Shewanella corallii]